MWPPALLIRGNAGMLAPLGYIVVQLRARTALR
jgi:hypothetical protein